MAGVVTFGIVFLVYLNLTFPRVRREAAKHLESPDTAANCFACHLKATPKIAQDWYEGNRGVILVKSFV